MQTIGIALAMDGPRQRHADAQIKNQEDQTSADFTRLLALSFFGGKRLDSRSRTLSVTESHIFLPNQCHGDPFNEMKKTYSLHQIKLVNKTYDFQKKPLGMPQKKRSRRNASLFQP